MIRRFLMGLSARLPAREITRGDGEPYLERYYVGRLFGWTFYLHRFLSGDEGVHLHDHPWRLSWSLILCGRYRETRLRRIDGDGVHTRQRRFRPGRLNIIRGTDFHRIDLPDGREAWTLFVHGRRIRRWGFLFWEQVDRDWVVEYCSHRNGFSGSQDPHWHLSAPTGAQLREEQRFRAETQIRDGFRRMKEKRQDETAA